MMTEIIKKVKKVVKRIFIFVINLPDGQLAKTTKGAWSRVTTYRVTISLTRHRRLRKWNFFISRAKIRRAMYALWRVIIFLACFSVVASGSSQSNKNFTECNLGKQFIHKNKAGKAKIMVCGGEINGVPQWQYTDGSSTIGEVFNPAKDCSHIFDQLPEAEDGFYWISNNNKTKLKVWCDLHTDGGGFMLVAMKDGPKSWTVPSNPTPVHPQGPPHWSSVLGDIKVLDFGIQISSDKTFQSTEAHWFYHFNQKRQLGNLFTNDKTTGCTASDPGIGDVMYVKDVLTETVATSSFKCSIFGPHTHPNLGWARMNYCLRHACKGGYGVIPGFSFLYTQYGSFSYSAVSPSAGTDSNCTAFIGCDHGKCCACFGPKDGKLNYCGPKCTAMNGGTVMRKAFVWFWVRTRMPKRLWKKCMEFTKRNSAGEVQRYFIDHKTGTVHKGSCSGQFKTFLNEGTLTVSNKESFEKIPNVPGFLSYRKDTKQLYVNQGSQWQALGTEREVEKLQDEVKRQSNTNEKQQNNIEDLQNKIQSQQNKIESQEKTIEAQGNMIKRLERQYQGLVDLKNWLHPEGPTCTKLRKRQQLTSSGTYMLSSPAIGSPVKVYCDMTSKHGVGVTVIGHDRESKTFVSGCDTPGCYKRKINYDISMAHIVAIIGQSQRCEQFIRYRCYESVFRFYSKGTRYSWWVSRQGWYMNYWGGAAVNSGKCACGMTNRCAGGYACNCDINKQVWREDSGYLTDKNTLPVTELRFGDVDGNNEYGYYKLGKLRCWG